MTALGVKEVVAAAEFADWTLEEGAPDAEETAIEEDADVAEGTALEVLYMYSLHVKTTIQE